MQIVIKLLSDRKFTIDIEPSDTLEILKAKIQAAEGVPSDQQWLIFGGMQMKEEKTMADYNIYADATIHLILWPV